MKDNILHDGPCPECRKNGRDKTGNHLITFKDGNQACTRCTYKNFVTKKEGENNLQSSISSIEELPFLSAIDRKISKETYSYYGVRSECDEATGEVVARYYPITKDKKIVGYKKRKLPKCFSVIGDGKGKVELFGQWVTERGGKKLLITGGEEDCCAAREMLVKRYPNYDHAVVSLPKGENITGAIDQLEFIMSFGEVIIATDMDEVGRKLAEQLVSLIGYEKSRVLIISEKDISDMRTNGLDKEFINAYFSAKPFVPATILRGSLETEEIMSPLKHGVVIKSFPKLMKKLRGFREAEMTLILAPTGVGKTTVSKQIGYELLAAGRSVYNIFLEEDVKKTQQSYIALDNNIRLPSFRMDPTILSKEQVNRSREKLFKEDKAMWLDHFGSISPDELMKGFRYAAAMGMEFGILDHISMVFSGLETSNERKDIDMLLTELAAFTKESKIHPIIVSHIKRSPKSIPKEKDGSVKYPYWDTVAVDAARGSGAFEQLGWNIITIEPEILAEGVRGRIRIGLPKNREWGELGRCDIVKMDEVTGHLVDAEDKILF